MDPSGLFGDVLAQLQDLGPILGLPGPFYLMDFWAQGLKVAWAQGTWYSAAQPHDILATWHCTAQPWHGVAWRGKAQHGMARMARSR